MEEVGGLEAAVEAFEGVAVGDDEDGLVLVGFFGVLDDRGHAVPEVLEVFDVVEITVQVGVGGAMGKGFLVGGNCIVKISAEAFAETRVEGDGRAFQVIGDDLGGLGGAEEIGGIYNSVVIQVVKRGGGGDGSEHHLAAFGDERMLVRAEGGIGGIAVLDVGFGQAVAHQEVAVVEGGFWHGVWGINLVGEDSIADELADGGHLVVFCGLLWALSEFTVKKQ